MSDEEVLRAVSVDPAPPLEAEREAARRSGGTDPALDAWWADLKPRSLAAVRLAAVPTPDRR